MFAVYDRSSADPVMLENLAYVLDALVWLSSYHGFGHEFVYFDVHIRSCLARLCGMSFSNQCR